MVHIRISDILEKVKDDRKSQKNSICPDGRLQYGSGILFLLFGQHHIENPQQDPRKHTDHTKNHRFGGNGNIHLRLADSEKQQSRQTDIIDQVVQVPRGSARDKPAFYDKIADSNQRKHRH